MLSAQDFENVCVKDQRVTIMLNGGRIMPFIYKGTMGGNILLESLHGFPWTLAPESISAFTPSAGDENGLKPEDPSNAVNKVAKANYDLLDKLRDTTLTIVCSSRSGNSRIYGRITELTDMTVTLDGVEDMSLLGGSAVLKDVAQITEGLMISRGHREELLQRNGESGYRGR